jgi:hypothetical protein
VGEGDGLLLNSPSLTFNQKLQAASAHGHTCATTRRRGTAPDFLLLADVLGEGGWRLGKCGSGRSWFSSWVCKTRFSTRKSHSSSPLWPPVVRMWLGRDGRPTTRRTPGKNRKAPRHLWPSRRGRFRTGSSKSSSEREREKDQETSLVSLYLSLCIAPPRTRRRSDSSSS